MILDPGILALLVLSAITCGTVIFSCRHAVAILSGWDRCSGSEKQLELERRTYLVSTLVACALVVELSSLVLFVATADGLHSRFAGAMCAAGVLKVNAYGYPALVLKMVVFFFGGIWLILNHADSRAYDYPLVKAKYRFLLLLSLPFVMETLLLWAFALKLKPDVITSCCGSLFSAAGKGVGGELAGLPPLPVAVMLTTLFAVTVVSGGCVVVRGRGVYPFAAASCALLIVTFAAVISFISLYFYELPTHHCPFCLLQREYGFIGYPIYALTFAGGIAGGGAGLLHPLRTIPSLRLVISLLQRKLAAVGLSAYLVAAVIVGIRIATADFTLFSP